MKRKRKNHKENILLTKNEKNVNEVKSELVLNHYDASIAKERNQMQCTK